jgi:exodeoxyribonuclease-5
LIDYQLPPLEVKLNLNALYSEQASLSNEQQNQLQEAVLEDVAHQPDKYTRIRYLKNSPYFNALQVKPAYAVTCHKSQGGQWPVVFIDQGYLTKEMLNREYTRWLYTAITRATEKAYLINFNEDFFL